MFLGYAFTPEGRQVAEATFDRVHAWSAWRYEQGADARRIGHSMRRRFTWWVAGIAGQPLGGPYKTVRALLAYAASFIRV